MTSSLMGGSYRKPSGSPGLPFADELEQPLQRLAGRGVESHRPLRDAAGQNLEVQTAGRLLDDAGAPRASPQEVPHERPVLSPGKLQVEEAVHGLVREVLILHAHSSRKRSNH